MKSQQPTKIKRFSAIMKLIFATEQDELTCGECFEQVDQYVDLLRAGHDAAAVLPKVKRHLDQCQCCRTEFEALIQILEGETDDAPHAS